MLEEVQTEVDKIGKFVSYVEKNQKIFMENENLEGWAVSIICQYICVAMCGSLENSIENILNQYVKKKADERTGKYVSSSIDRSFRSPNSENIKQILGRFDKDWQKNIEKNCLSSNSKCHAQINAIISQKNLIAHGGSSDISFQRVKEYYDSYHKTLKFIHDLVLES